MACYRPIDVFQVPGETRVFFGRPFLNQLVTREFQIPCGRCVGCRLRRSAEWATRVLHEASLYQVNSFITLTYNNEHLPSDGSLRYPDFQRFIKRLRERLRRDGLADIRFYMAGEYGSKRGRPHYHACIFGYDFPDRVEWMRTPVGSLLYRSAFLESLWPYGYSSVGELTFESAAYTARYIMKKQFGDTEPMIVTGKP